MTARETNASEATSLSEMTMISADRMKSVRTAPDTMVFSSGVWMPAIGLVAFAGFVSPRFAILFVLLAVLYGMLLSQLAAGVGHAADQLDGVLLDVDAQQRARQLHDRAGGEPGQRLGHDGEGAAVAGLAGHLKDLRGVREAQPAHRDRLQGADLHPAVGAVAVNTAAGVLVLAAAA
jgi:hypothetical protein